MSDCEQFDDKDRSFIEETLKSVNVPYGEPIIIKRFTGVNDPGDPAVGIQPKLGFVLIATKGIINSVQQQDIMNSGGLYQLGDITVELTQKLNYIDTIPQTGGVSEGDRLNYEGHEYRIVGKQDTHVLVGKNQLFSYVFRKIGDA